MKLSQKKERLDALTEPFGFSLLPDKDIITSTYDAWQREFGYTTLFDRSALHFNMVFDCEPIYFDYNGRTWLIEFWKGQYGINTGCEIGIYYADSIVEPENRSSTHFQSADDSSMIPIQMELFYRGKSLFALENTHWWLTGFQMGLFSHPEELSMEISLTFPNCIMLQSFVGGLIEAGYALHELRVAGCRISYVYEASCDRGYESSCMCCEKRSASSARTGFHFTLPHAHQPRHDRRILTAFKQWKNRIFCRLYLWVTRPFTETADRLLSLYYLLPLLLRRMLCFRKSKSQKSPKRRRRKTTQEKHL